MAREVPQMVRGLGMAMRLLSSLIDQIKEHGGNEEMLYFLTTDRGLDNLKKVAGFIVSLEWRVPKSILMKLSRQLSIQEHGSGYADSDEKIFWEPALMELGIPYVRFTFPDSANGMNPEEDYLLDELREQLDGKKLAVAMQVKWNGDEYVLASIGYRYEIADDPMPGDVIEMGRLDFVHLMPARYIDLDR